MDKIRTLGRIYRLARAMFPERRWKHWKNRVLLQARTLKYLSAVQAWYAIADNPWLDVAQKRFPALAGAIYLPYIHQDWTPPQRLAAIELHYRLLDARTAILALSISEAVEVARFDTEYPGLRLVLDKPAWFNREGEAVLNLFVGDHRCYSVAFTLGVERGERILIVGALQGSGFPNAMELYRDLTRALHGMRPRDLLLTALKFMAMQFGIQRLQAISSAKRWQVHADYDGIWQEHQGELLDNGFYALPTEVSRREAADVPAKKRKTYRLRYEMLERLNADIAAACVLATASLTGPGLRSGDIPPAETAVGAVAGGLIGSR